MSSQPIESLESRRLLAAGQFAANFGSAGRVFSPPPDSSQARDLIAQADGKILIAKTDANNRGFTVERRLANGSIDSSFGDAGTVQLDFGDSSPSLANRVESLAIQSDNKILIAGEAGGGFAIARLNPDGSLDHSFNATGMQIVRFANASASLREIALKSDGRIVLAGGFGANFGIAQLTSAGQLDTSFGDGGKIRQNLPGSSERINSVAIQSDGKILVGGFDSDDPHSNHRMVIERFTSAGKLDTSFGTGGMVLPKLGIAPAVVNAVRIAPDGSIVIGAVNETNSFAIGSQALVLKLTTKGAYDTHFNGSGHLAIPASTPYDPADGYSLSDLRVASDGRIYFAGNNVVVRLSATGAVDSTFGNGDAKHPGAHVSIYQSFSIAKLRVLSNGNILVAGTASTPDPLSYAAVARLTSTGKLDTTFGDGGRETVNLAGIVGRFNAIAALADGRFYTVGFSETPASSTYDALVERRRSDGSLDPTFANGGVFTFDSGVDDEAFALAVQSDGKLVVVGQSTPPEDAEGDVFPFFLRLTTRGKLDTTFHSGLLKSDSLTGLGAGAVTVLTDGQIIVGTRSVSDDQGYVICLTSNGQRDKTFATGGFIPLRHTCQQLTAISGNQFLALFDQDTLVRLNANGSQDATFGAKGQVALKGIATSFSIGPDGKIVVAGAVLRDNGNVAAFSRYTSNGKLDTTFGGGGVAKVFTNEDSFLDDVLVQRDGKILGVDAPDTIRLNSNGSVDTTFGDAGVLHSPFPEERTEIFYLAQLANGLLVGAAAAGSAPSPALVAYTSDNTQPAVAIGTLSHSGTLTIASSSLQDDIEISDNGTKVVVQWNGQTQSFSSVKRIFLDAGAGNDDITNTSKKPATLIGGDGADQIFGGPGNESIVGGAGNDLLLGDQAGTVISTSDDTLIGGDGDDVLFGGNGNDSLDGGAGNDTLWGNDVGDEHSPNERNTLNGGDGFDSIIASPGGESEIDGGAGDDSITGSLYDLPGESAVITGGDGNDNISGTAGNDSILGGAGNDTIQAGPGNDTLDAGSGSNYLSGDEGDDLLLAKNHSHDTVDGGDGIDRASVDNSGGVKDSVFNVESFVG